MDSDDDQYRSIADVMPQMMWTTDREGRVDWINRRVVEYVGTAVRSGPFDEVSVHPDDRALVRERWAGACGTGDGFELEYRIRRHDGAYR